MNYMHASIYYGPFYFTFFLLFRCGLACNITSLHNSFDWLLENIRYVRSFTSSTTNWVLVFCFPMRNHSLVWIWAIVSDFWRMCRRFLFIEREGKSAIYVKSLKKERWDGISSRAKGLYVDGSCVQGI